MPNYWFIGCVGVGIVWGISYIFMEKGAEDTSDKTGCVILNLEKILIRIETFSQNRLYDSSYHIYYCKYFLVFCCCKFTFIIRDEYYKYFFLIDNLYNWNICNKKISILLFENHRVCFNYSRHSHNEHVK